MDQQKRLMLAFALSFIVLLAAQMFFAKPPVKGAQADAGVGAVAGPTGEPAPSAPVAQGEQRTESDGGLPVAAAPSALPMRAVEVSRAQVHYVFTSEGGALSRAELLGPKMREQEPISWGEALGRLLGKKGSPAPQMNLAEPALGRPLPLAVWIQGDSPLSGTTRYQVSEDLANRRLTFSTSEGGWRVEKTFQWQDDGFELGYTVHVKNTTAQARRGELWVNTIRAIDPSREEQPSIFGQVGNQAKVTCAYAEEFKSALPLGKPPEVYTGPVSFFGVDQQYFLTAVFPLEGPRPGRCELAASATERSAQAVFPLEVQPGQEATFKFGVFMGPKDTDVLAAVPSPAQLGSTGVSGSLHLERTVDYGWWTVICKLLLAVLKLCHRVVPNWGLAIVLLTVIVRLLMTPFNHRMMVGQVAMQKLQPKIEALKKKYPEDKERQQMEMMKIYQEAGVNPFGSCLLLLVQMPIWIALFRTLRNSYEIYREPFFGPLWTDLTYKDPSFILPVLLGISQILTTRLQPQTSMDPSQQRLMNWFMPIMFTAFLLNYPMGLTLYIFTSNVLGVAQQYTSKRLIARAST
jgi:YidC/Oxa1 family membrane protein insertase